MNPSDSKNYGSLWEKQFSSLLKKQQQQQNNPKKEIPNLPEQYHQLFHKFNDWTYYYHYH